LGTSLHLRASKNKNLKNKEDKCLTMLCSAQLLASGSERYIGAWLTVHRCMPVHPKFFFSLFFLRQCALPHSHTNSLARSLSLSLRASISLCWPCLLPSLVSHIHHHCVTDDHQHRPPFSFQSLSHSLSPQFPNLSLLALRFSNLLDTMPSCRRHLPAHRHSPFFVCILATPPNSPQTTPLTTLLQKNRNPRFCFSPKLTLHTTIASL